MSFNLSSKFTEGKTVKEAINKAIQTLEKAGIEDASHNANLMAAKLLAISYTKLPFYWTKPASQQFLENFSVMLERRLANEPLQYILEEWSFLDFDITALPGALIPRPETEEVFLAAVKAIKEKKTNPSFVFADIGTGTGVLGIAMAKYFPDSKGTLVDISEEALKITQINVNKFPEIKERLTLLKSDLLQDFDENSLDVIISNPPYIDSDEVKTLMPEVVNYEPHLALDGGIGGIEIINKLLIQAQKVLKPNGLFIFEHGHGQRKAITDILTAAWSIIKAGNDFAGNERYFVLLRNKKSEKNKN